MVHGDRTEPDKLLAYVRFRCKHLKEDIKHNFRITERIFTRTITPTKFKKYVQNSKAKVDFHASEKAYHVSKQHINKGSALKKLTYDLRFGSDDVVIAVGDSGLDVPMFKEAEISFAVANAPSEVQKQAHVTLQNKTFDGVMEMYNGWFRR